MNQLFIIFTATTAIVILFMLVILDFAYLGLEVHMFRILYGAAKHVGQT